LEAIRRGLFERVTQHTSGGYEGNLIRSQHDNHCSGMRKRGADCPLRNLISTAAAFTSAHGSLQFVGYIKQPTLEYAGFSVNILVRFTLKYH
jgi:hypothetical protein